MSSSIFRYTNLNRISSIFEEGIFYVPNRSRFSDKREFGFHGSLKEITNTFRNSGTKFKSTNKRLEETEESRKFQHISCWTLDKYDDNNTKENFLMWSAYAKDDNLLACRIKSSIGTIVHNIKELQHDLFIAQIQYENYENMHLDSFQKRLFSKACFYRAEQEVRLLFLTNSQLQFLPVKVNKESFIEEITLSPFLTSFDCNFVEDYIIRKWPFLKNKIKKAEVLEPKN